MNTYYCLFLIFILCVCKDLFCNCRWRSSIWKTTSILKQMHVGGTKPPLFWKLIRNATHAGMLYTYNNNWNFIIFLCHVALME